MAPKLGPQHGLIMVRDRRYARSLRDVRRGANASMVSRWSSSPSSSPCFLLLFVALIEFAMVLNAVLSINFATRASTRPIGLET